MMAPSHRGDRAQRAVLASRPLATAALPSLAGVAHHNNPHWHIQIKFISLSALQHGLLIQEKLACTLLYMGERAQSKERYVLLQLAYSRYPVFCSTFS